MKTATKKPKSTTGIEPAPPLDPVVATPRIAAALRRELGSELALNSNVWTPVFDLVAGGSGLYPDSGAFWSAHCAMSCDIKEKRGFALFNRYEEVEGEMQHRLVQTAYAAGWVASGQKLELVAGEALNLSDVAERLIGLTTMLAAVFAAMPSLDAVVVKESCAGFADVVELVQTKAETINAGLRQIAKEAR